jgi:hypothetical protein
MRKPNADSNLDANRNAFRDADVHAELVPGADCLC